jgi:hypothetical protein
VRRASRKWFSHSTSSNLGLLAAAILGLTLPLQAEASDFDGKIRSVKFSSGSSSPRVSIQVGQHRSTCSKDPEWFAFENADQGIGAIWTSTLIAAVSNDRSVSIYGTEACDAYGIEGVLAIELR